MNFPHKSSLRLLLALSACFGSLPIFAHAAPAQPQVLSEVVNGQVSFAQQGNVFSITSTPGAIINWQSFSVAAGETTRFIQQSADSAVLNRVVGQDPSRILGALQSNGHVFLINPNGILFGKDARVDVAGLTASTLDIANGDFTSGRRSFSAGAKAGAIVNAGRIATPKGGSVYLIATSVENSGVISTPDGSAVLAAGRSVQLADAAHPEISVTVAAPQDAAINLGQMVARGGRIGIYGALVRQQGGLDADSAQIGANGKIVLRASGDVLVDGSSVTSARGAGTGGEITVLGQRVGVTGNARIDASGGQGGGMVLLGGDVGGANPRLPHARQTLLGKDATIAADASVAGAGGKVVLWSDGSTRAFGRISARGAGQGNGGLVETSGQVLGIAGLRVDTRASGSGKTGTWLLDPYNIVINSDAPAAPWSAIDEFTDDPNETTTEIGVGAFANLDLATNVVVQARNDLSINADLMRPSGTKGSTTLEAGNNINVNSAIDTGGGALSLNANAGAYASGEGSVMLRAPIDTGAAKLFASGNQVIMEEAGRVRAGGIDLRASDLSMYSGSQLQSGGAVNLVADRMALGGSIGALDSKRPLVSILTLSSNRPIDIVEFDYTDGASLHLAPSELATIDAASIAIGSDAIQGHIGVGAPLLLGSQITRDLSLQTQGDILVDAPLNLQPGGAGTLRLTAGGLLTVGPSGTVAADSIVLRADSMDLAGVITNAGQDAGTVALMPWRGITGISIGGGPTAELPDYLVLSSAELGTVTTNHLSIGGNPGQLGDVHVAALSALSANPDDPNPPPVRTLNLSAGAGQLLVDGALVTDHDLHLQGKSIATAIDARITAPTLALTAAEGIGNKAMPLQTATAALTANNHRTGGSAPVNIENTGVLALGSITQTGSANVGEISVLNHGGMTLEPAQMVATQGSGKVSLKTMSPLTIAGSVNTASGAVILEAGNGGALTVATSGSINAGGNVSLTGGEISNFGLVRTTSGAITTAGLVKVAGNMQSPATAPVTPNEPTKPTEPTVPTEPTEPTEPTVPVEPPKPIPPTLAQCIANPAASGCASVLPTIAECVATPAASGCQVVLPTIGQCTSSPTTTGCSVVLPTLAQCSAAPATAGCSVVLPSLAQCTADPTAAGCAVVLPTIGACTAAPTTAGCSVVLPSLAQCMASPTAPGCAVVLPSLAQCTASPTAPGCSVVLPSLDQCTASPSVPGCAVVLPTISQCALSPSTPGCSAVLPTLAQCTVAPATAGCGAVLPSLGQCTVNPGQPGCSVVLPTLAACSANPATAGCSVVLPTLSACVAAPATAGCAVVLPTLAQCVDSPSLQGCAVVLPPVQRCVADPNAPGCVVVVPPRQTPAGSPVQEALQTTVNLINQAGERTNDLAVRSDPVEGKPVKESAGSLPASDNPNQGGKRALLKTYCN